MKTFTSTLLVSVLLGHGSAAVVGREEGLPVNSSSYDFVRCFQKPGVHTSALGMI
jgi:hypothetical protein